MIYLYTLPGVSFNAPQLTVPLVKGYLQENNIKSKQIDLSINFFEKCVNSHYIKTNLKKYYKSLSKKDKNIVDEIDKSIFYLKDKKINTQRIIKANERLLKYLDIFSNCYDISWDRKGLRPYTSIKKTMGI